MPDRKEEKIDTERTQKLVEDHLKQVIITWEKILPAFITIFNLIDLNLKIYLRDYANFISKARDNHYYRYFLTKVIIFSVILGFSISYIFNWSSIAETIILSSILIALFTKAFTLSKFKYSLSDYIKQRRKILSYQKEITALMNILLPLNRQDNQQYVEKLFYNLNDKIETFTNKIKLKIIITETPDIIAFVGIIVTSLIAIFLSIYVNLIMELNEILLILFRIILVIIWIWYYYIKNSGEDLEKEKFKLHFQNVLDELIKNIREEQKKSIEDEINFLLIPFSDKRVFLILYILLVFNNFKLYSDKTHGYPNRKYVGTRE